MTTQYERFQQVTDEIYDGCTTEQKLGVYIQHHPAAVVPFLLELIELLYTLNDLNPVEDPPNDTARQD